MDAKTSSRERRPLLHLPPALSLYSLKPSESQVDLIFTCELKLINCFLTVRFLLGGMSSTWSFSAPHHRNKTMETRNNRWLIGRPTVPDSVPMSFMVLELWTLVGWLTWDLAGNRFQPKFALQLNVLQDRCNYSSSSTIIRMNNKMIHLIFLEFYHPIDQSI